MRSVHLDNAEHSVPCLTRKIIRGRKVRERVGKSRTSLWRAVKNGSFPAPVSIGANAIGWYEDEIDDWLERRPRVHYAPRDEAEKSAT